jgi:hypothetical protein
MRVLTIYCLKARERKMDERRTHFLKMGLASFLWALVIIVILFHCNACGQTVHLKYRWDKNTETDMSHYDLFRVLSTDSVSLWEMSTWPADSTVVIIPDTAIHYHHLFATVAHIYSPIDSMIFEYDQDMFQGYLRAWICAVDSAGNASPLGVSINAVFIGDAVAPERPRILEFRRE